MASNLTSVLTNGTGTYALTAQEDNAVLEVLVRAHKAKSADYGRVILFRAASNFDRAPPHQDDLTHFLHVSTQTELIKPASVSYTHLTLPTILLV